MPRALRGKKLDAHSALQQCQWFLGLPSRFQRAFLDGGHVVEYSAGQRIVSPGDLSGSLYCVLDGAARISSINGGGTENLLVIMEPVSWFGEIALSEKCHRKYTVAADKDSQLFILPHDVLNDLLEKDPVLWQEIARLLSRKFMLVLDAMESIGSLSGAGRLANRLAMISTNYGSWASRRRRTIKIPQDDLAKMAFLSRSTTNILLKEFERRGALVLKYGKIELKDLDVLEEIASGDVHITCDTI